MVGRLSRSLGRKACIALLVWAAVVSAVAFMPSSAYAAQVVPGLSPHGTTINLFDYWLDTRDAPDDQQIGQYENGGNIGINAGHALKFGNGMGQSMEPWQASSANINHWTQGANPRVGIVQDELGADGYPVLSSSVGSTESLAYLFDPDADTEARVAFSDVGGLLRVDDQGYYVYSSQDSFAEFNEESNSFTLYDEGAVTPIGSHSPFGQFYPFNSADYVFTKSWDGSLTPNTAIDSYDCSHYFGLSITSRFVQKYGGYTAPEDSGGTPVTYNFTGDDDIWVFIDGVLVGDLGGIHDSTSIEINFATGDVIVYNDVTSNNEYDPGSDTRLNADGTTLGSLMGLDGDTFDDGTYHTLKFFYLERGNGDSNMALKYNLVNVPESDVLKVDQVGDPIEGVGFRLEAADSSYEPLAGQDAYAVEGTTDENGGFVLVRDEDGRKVPVSLVELEARSPYWVLGETDVPAGYRSSGDMLLRFEAGRLMSTNSWDTGAWSRPHLTVVAGETAISEAGDGVDASSGVMFCIIEQQDDLGKWYPVSGGDEQGWHVAAGSGIEDIVNAAKETQAVFQMGNGRSREAFIENLPGDIASYGDDASGWGPRHRVTYWWSPDVTSLDDLNAGCTLIPIDGDASGFEVELSATLTVPNIKNELTLMKVDEDTGDPVPGAYFGLYADEDLDGIADTGECLSTMVTNMDGSMKVTTYGDLLEAGRYVLIEKGKPATHKVNDSTVSIVVDDDGVHVDAGSAGDGVTVKTGLGTLVWSMKGFAAGDDVDATLHDVIATAQAADVFEGETTAWVDSGAAPSHMCYQEPSASGSLRYGLTPDESGNGLGSFIADEGWSRLQVTQCLAHDGASGSPKRNLSDPSQPGYIAVDNLNALFTGEVIIYMTDKAEEVTGPALTSEAVMVNTFIVK